MIKEILQKAKDLQSEMVENRRIIHQNAEIGMKLPATSDFVKKKLTDMGYTPLSLCESGIVAIAGGSNSGKTILLRADMDALPLPEKTEEPFKSVTGNMHACGHDMHTAMLLGAAKILKEYEDKLQGTVKLMFQPGEEILQGADCMIKNGILENPTVNMAMMIHVGTGMPMKTGTFTKPFSGPFTATSDWFKIEIQGKGGHGAMPETAIDPLIPAAHILLGLQEINAREIAASDSAVITVGILQGGNGANIISDVAVLEGTIRTFSSRNREEIKKRINQISTGIAEAFRSEVSVTFSNGCPSVVIDGRGAEIFNETASALFGEESLIPLDSMVPGGKVMGSEDFAFVTEKVPGVMVYLAAGDARDGYIYPPHHPGARFDEKPLYRGAAVYASFAAAWLEKNK